MVGKKIEYFISYLRTSKIFGRNQIQYSIWWLFNPKTRTLALYGLNQIEVKVWLNGL